MSNNRSESAQENSISIYDDASPVNPEARFECAICTNWLQDPVLTSCGHRFCKQCIASWLQRKDTCPIDYRKLQCESDIFPDNFTRREIQQLRASCTNAHLGCTARLSPLELEEHMNQCSFNVAHGLEAKHCAFKEIGCDFISSRDDVIKTHIEKGIQHHLNLLMSAYTQMPRRPSAIDLKASESSLWDAPSKENQQNGSVDDSTSQNLIKAMYERIVILEQKNREQDTEIKNLTSKLRTLNVEAQLQIEDLLETKYCNGVHIWKIDQIKEKVLEMKRDPTVMYYSKGVYTSPYGYGFCARINISPKEPKCLALHIHMMKTENDSSLSWPFSGRINLTLVHPKDSSSSQYDTIMSRPEVVAFQRPTSDIAARGFGFLDYTTLQKLAQFVENDTLTIKMQLQTV